jgi:hypothetical protein
LPLTGAASFFGALSSSDSVTEDSVLAQSCIRLFNAVSSVALQSMSENKHTAKLPEVVSNQEL